MRVKYIFQILKLYLTSKALEKDLTPKEVEEIKAVNVEKQKLEEVTMNPIICIGNYHIDKKIKELMNKRKPANIVVIDKDKILEHESVESEILPF